MKGEQLNIFFDFILFKCMLRKIEINIYSFESSVSAPAIRGSNPKILSEGLISKYKKK